MTALTQIDSVREQVSLAERTWFKLGGPAQFFAEPASVDELLEIVKRCRDEGLQVRLLGGGSNVLVRDEGVSGTVIALSHPSFSEIRIDGRRATVGGGAKLANAVSVTVGAGLSGLEPHDAATLVATIVVLLGISLVAGLLPARRAAIIDPVEALRDR